MHQHVLTLLFLISNLASSQVLAADDYAQAISEQREVLQQRPKDAAARQKLAEIGWQLARQIEDAENLEDTDHAERLQQQIEQTLPDIVWRTRHYADKEKDPRALLAQAVLLRTGTLIEANPRQACDYYRQASAAGVVAAHWQYSRCLQKIDRSAALELAKSAATAGHLQAMQFVAEVGLTSKDPGVRSSAVEMLQHAAAAGRPSALLLLGALYETGTVVDTDLSEAARHYRVIAEKGHTVAQNNLGALYQRQGKLDDAAAWYGLAARGKLPIAQLNLGLLQAQQGLDDCAALAWIRRAADSGLELATKVVENPETYRINCQPDDRQGEDEP